MIVGLTALAERDHYVPPVVSLSYLLSFEQ